MTSLINGGKALNGGELAFNRKKQRNMAAKQERQQKAFEEQMRLAAEAAEAQARVEEEERNKENELKIVYATDLPKMTEKRRLRYKKKSLKLAARLLTNDFNKEEKMDKFVRCAEPFIKYGKQQRPVTK